MMANSKKLSHSFPSCLMSPEEIRQFSVTKNGIQNILENGKDHLVSKISDNSSNPVDGENHNGSKDTTQDCHTYGHIELVEPVFHMAFITETMAILESICFHCSKLLVNPSHPAVKKILLETKGQPRQRLVYIHDLCKAQSTCKSDNTNFLDGEKLEQKSTQNCNGCGQCQPIFSRVGMEIKAEWIIEDGREVEKISLSAEQVFQIFKRIREKDCNILGLDPCIARPEWMIVTVVPVPLFLSSQQRDKVNFTKKINSVINSNNELQKLKKNGATTLVVRENLKKLQFHVATMVEIDGPELPEKGSKLTNTSELDRRSLLYKWNHTALTYPSGVLCIHQLFEMQVEQVGHATAVVYKGTKLTYNELNNKANQLAYYLIQKGVIPEMRVALCVDRGPSLIVALLGILKAGAAYVPLDPAYPGQRLTDILNDATPFCLIVDTTGRTALKSHKMSTVDLDKPLPTKLGTHNPPPDELHLTPANIAYVIYTSGSTGVPKGVMVEHRQIVRLFSVTREVFSFDQNDIWCLFHSYSFDVSVWEIWGALSNGGQLAIVPYSTSRSAIDFYKWICTSGVTILNQTPTAFRTFLQGKEFCSESDQLKWVIFGGEAFNAQILADWNEKFPQRKTMLVNMYGTTETTVHATIHQLSASEWNTSIGRPLSDLCIYILDENREFVPSGCQGEIYIGGAGVARGYLNKPDLTVKNFLLDPFSEIPGARLYRTGDQGCFMTNGNITYLGRLDQQIKIRGFRIEPAEIEARLLEHPKVKQAVVMSKGSGINKHLVAFVISDEQSVTTQELRNHLLAALPNYMVPAAFVNLKTLPLTVNGKLDVKALSTFRDISFAHQMYEKPEGFREETLAAIWKSLLNTDKVGRHDNFFVLGGNSLHVGEMLAQLHQSELSTSVEAIFNSPNLSALAERVGNYHPVYVPQNLIQPDSTEIVPGMLSLITLSQCDIDRIVASVSGGVSNIQDIYSLTPLQHGMLSHHMNNKKGDPYLLRTFMRFSERNALDSYTAALQKVIERHDILRTAFIWEELPEPAQVVWRKVPSVLTECSFQNLSGKAISNLENQFDPQHYRLDLTKASLLHLIVAPLTSGGWEAVQLYHHLIWDHFTEEMVDIEIQAISMGQEKNLMPSIPFRNCVAQSLLDISSEEHTKFFSDMLSDIDEPTLPFGLRDIHLSGAEVTEVECLLPPTLNSTLRLQAQHLQVSLASLCHLAFGRVLSCVTGLSAVVFGTVLLGRLQNGGKNTRALGLWMNTLPFRLDIDQTTVESSVRETHIRLSNLLAHEYAPLSMAQRCSNIPSNTPLFSAILNFRHNNLSAKLSLPGVEVMGFDERTNYPLMISIEDNGNSLGITTQVIAPLSGRRITTYMREALLSLSDALINLPHQKVQELNVLPWPERTLLTETWNHRIISSSSPCHCIHQLFEAQAEQNLQALAIKSEKKILSYFDLNSQANQLANYLIQLGVKPDTKAAICMMRETNLVVAILGVLKAGGAYVPLDPVHSSKRLNTILNDAEPMLLITDATGLEALGTHKTYQVPVINMDQPLPTSLTTGNPQRKNLDLIPSHLAYVFYTSGSTGTPKGVMVEHRHVSRLFHTTSFEFKFSNKDKWCLFHSFSFDLSVWEIWGSLLYGGQLTIPSLDIIRSTFSFYDWICTSGITVLNETPSAFRMLIQAKNDSSKSDMLRYIIIGGDVFDSLIVKKWFEKNLKNPTILYNAYGPTETTVHTTFHRIEPSDYNTVSIGRPLPDLKIYLLNNLKEPLPIGAEGELYIGGAGVTRGYLNRPELTREFFLTDPFSELGSRMYRTGDKAYYLPDGNLVFVGRVDHQLKIRGFRIEPAEIEKSLVEHSHVKEAVVIARDKNLDKQLVAYIVMEHDSFTAQDLRNHLITRLPDYMIPTAFVFLSALPLNCNVKLDRRALPEPGEHAFAHQKYEAPQDAIEEKLAAIWSDILKRKQVSRHDNFFALGGHSLLIMKLMSLLRQFDLTTSVQAVFETPTLALLAQTIKDYQHFDVPPNVIQPDCTTITPDMLPLISLSQKDIDLIVSQVSGGVSNIQDIYSLGPLQNGILFHHLNVTEGDPYLLSYQIQFSNEVVFNKYTDALQKVIERHDILRTAFMWEGLSEPAQVVLRQVEPVLSKAKLVNSEENILVQLKSLYHPRHYSLNLNQPPLIRLVVAETSETNRFAILLLHHLLCDHFTMDILQAEIKVIISDQQDELQPPIPYRNLVAQAFLGDNPEEQKKFFSKMLAGIDEPTLPFGLSNINLDGTNITESFCQLPQSFYERLCIQAQRLGVSLASVCHLAYGLVLSSISGQDVVVFGTVLFGRMKDGGGSNNAIGLWINTLPICINIDQTDVETDVRDAQARLSALMSHEHTLLSLAQRCSRIPSGMPLFSALLNYRHNKGFKEVNIPGVEFLGGEERTNYPLTLSVEDYGNGLGFTAQVVQPHLPERICSYMREALLSIMLALETKSQEPIQTLNILSYSERILQIETWNETPAHHHPSNLCLHEYFEVQVDLNNYAPALEFEGATLSYMEVNTRANQLAHYLLDRGVRPDTRVAICVSRCPNLVVALLAVLKAGGAYVPLDPAYSSKRLMNILHNSEPLLLLVNSAGMDALGTSSIPFINMDIDLPQDLPTSNPQPKNINLTSANLAYVIYTSGSTGDPKGVMVEHRNVTRLFHTTRANIDFSSVDKWCLFHSFSFDVSVWEIWGALVYGASLAIPPLNMIRATEYFYNWLCASAITVLTQTPSSFKAFLQAMESDSKFDILRYLILGGETIDPLVVNKWFHMNRKKSTVLYNFYGPTETVAFATFYKIEPLNHTIISIGRPLPDLIIYLLNNLGVPVPIGAEGEIYVGGAGVARGYLNQPELTSAYFLPDPFGHPGSRMYRTGDRAYYLPDGNLVVLGRIDHQLKIRGFRIEPAEIEKSLVEHPYIREATVTVRETKLDKQLVAYVVADENSLNARDLRNHLITRLPDYMIPTAFVLLSALPLNCNGKLDRRALPDPDENSIAHQIYEAPQGEVEEKLAAIWSDILRKKQISRHDNFFALGGHSLLIIKLMAQLRHVGLDTSVQAVFEAPNLAAMAKTIKNYQAFDIPPNLIEPDCKTITPDMLPLISLSQMDIDVIVSQVPGGVSNIQDIYSLSPLQNSILFHHLNVTEGDPYLFLSKLHFSNQVAFKNYKDGLQKVIERHDILRTAFLWEELSEPAQVVFRQVESVLVRATLPDSTNDVLEQLTRMYNPRHYTLNLNKPPLIRLVVEQGSISDCYAILLLHHLLCDHSSLEVLQAEIKLIIRDQQDELQPPIPYRNLVAQAFLGDNPEEQKKFFSEMLAGIDEPTLPFGLGNINLDGTNITESFCQLPQSFYERLCIQAQRLGVSLASMCHLAYGLVLSSISGQDVVVFGTVLFGRMKDGGGSKNAIGLWINTLPICINIDLTDVETDVRDVQARLSALMFHEHTLLTFAQRCSRIPPGMPLFSALLNYRHNQDSKEINIPGVEILGGEERTSYPLTLSVEDYGNRLGFTAQVVQLLLPERICSYMREALLSIMLALETKSQEPIQTLNILPYSERILQIETWNETPAHHHPSNLCLHEYFEVQVDLNNYAPALEFESATLSYMEVSTRANQLAHYLLDRGVRPDTRVAICMSRCPNLVVALLAVLKAGGAYVPLDPAYSSKRLMNILHSSEPLLLLVNSAGMDALGTSSIPVINMDVDPSQDLATSNPQPKNLNLTSANLAYVIYTSGSTGEPKGVMVEHRNVTRLFNVIRTTLHFSKEDKWCLFHSFSFDVSVWEIWGALLNGGQLTIPSLNMIRSNFHFYNWICSSGITVLNQTPSAFRTLLQAKNDSSNCDILRYLIIAGDVLDPVVVNMWFETNVVSPTTLYNFYGPTETVIFATSYKIQPLKYNIISIGRSIPDLKIYLLNRVRNPVPIGSEGEIYIGGARVARGYLNRHKLTSQYFFADPFSRTGSRMYRTGDRAYYLPDGNLVFLGRMDHQIKIRGFRIEPAEIERSLVEHPYVREATVTVREKNSDKQLVAYVAADHDLLHARDLRDHLITRLPDFMIPTAFVLLSALPLNCNGKLDRRALPDPDENSIAHQIYEAPQGEVEEKLAAIWSALLGRQKISRYDNFFALGGHSLLVAKLLGQLHQSGLSTDVQAIFNSATFASMADTIVYYKSFTIPPYFIQLDSAEITPEMLPLISLTQSDIDIIVAQVPGGISNIQDIYGLSPLQQGILFHHLISKKGDPYMLITHLKFVDQRTLDLYASALRKIIQRHDVLRTAFIWEGISKPAQVVCRHVPSTLTHITLDAPDESVMKELITRFDSQHYRLDLTQPPLLRLIISPLSDGGWAAVQLFHHLISDQSTSEKLLMELNLMITGRENELTSSIPFRNLVAQSLCDLRAEERTQFFSKMLGDIEEPTLPFGLSDIHLNDNEVSEAMCMLSKTLNDSLRMQAKRLQVSLASLCHLAFGQFLSCVSGCENVVFGTVLLGRFQHGDRNEGAFGLWINTLPFRVNLGKKTVDMSVRETHSLLSALLFHEHTLLAMAQQCSRIPASMPLFTTIFNYRHHRPPSEISFPGIEVLGGRGRTNYPLALSVEDYGNGLGLTVQVVPPVLGKKVCSYMEEVLKSLADALTHLPSQSIETLSVLPQSERLLHLQTYNESTSDYRYSNYFMHQLFEANVEDDGSAPAIEFEGQILSYKELNFRVNKLAHFLIKEGVRPDTTVALCVSRGPTMIISLLAILKAGGAYVPLDPVHSSKRLINILKDSEPFYLLVDDSGRDALGPCNVPMVNLDEPLSINLNANNPRPDEVGLRSGHLAYVTYTSGSTGVPKGVMVEHRQLTKLFDVTHEKFEFSKEKKWCLFSSISFDVSVWDVWGSLGYGGSLAIAPFNTIRSPPNFYEWICDSNITVLSQTPSAFKMFLQARNNSLQSDVLQYIFIGGEELDLRVFKRWFELYSDRSTILMNMYGNTETTVQAICHEVRSSDDSNIIGRPLYDVKVYLLDTQLRLIPLGAEGELYVGGATVSRGYLNNPDLTGAYFFSDPFIGHSDARIYRTGDKARYMSDGNLIYLGRIDGQIKLRGFRIEPAEIEALLLECNANIKEAVVVAKGNDVDKHLIAYLVLDTDSLTAQDLRNYLITLLPDYMIPSAFVRLTALPLNPNGKLDHKALPPPDYEAFARQVYEAPSNEIEEKLSFIWSSVLGVERISRHDNFFELGGNSVFAMQFGSRAMQYGLKTRTGDLFRHPIMRNLALFEADRTGHLRVDYAIPARRFGSQSPLFFVPAGTGNHSYAFSLTHDIDSNFPVYLLPWPTLEENLPQSMEEMANRMIRIMKSVQANGPYAIAGYSSGGILAYEIAQQLTSGQYDHHTVQFVGLIDTYPPYIKMALEDTEFFLNFIIKSNVFPKIVNDSAWWDSISEMDLAEVIDEIKKISVEMKIIDIERDIRLWKQIYSYGKMVESYKIDTLSLPVNLFKATEFDEFTPGHVRLQGKLQDDMKKRKEIFRMSKLGWEMYFPSTNIRVISIKGNHITMMEDPKMRKDLGAKISEALVDSHVLLEG